MDTDTLALRLYTRHRYEVEEFDHNPPPGGHTLCRPACRPHHTGHLLDEWEAPDGTTVTDPKTLAMLTRKSIEQGV